jgi:glycosyltransferase involved in cell wall biosynthesis
LSLWNFTGMDKSVMRFSIVTPSFNQLDWLKLCMASVADQGCEVEHIVQDAGTDGLASLANAGYRKGYHPCLYVEKDKGMYDAINRGLRRATGDICAYLNCDEQYLPGTLDRVRTYFEQHPKVEVLFGDAVCTDQNGMPLSYRRMVSPSLLHTRVLPLSTLTCSTFFRRSIVDRGFLFDPSWKIRGDAIWVYDLLNAKIPMGVMPEPLAVFAFTGENQSETPEALAERVRWRESHGRASAGVRLFASLHHRLRKLYAGAYRTRTLNVALYTFKDGSKRTVLHAKMGCRWPRHKAPSTHLAPGVRS